MNTRRPRGATQVAQIFANFMAPIGIHLTIQFHSIYIIYS